MTLWMARVLRETVSPGRPAPWKHGQGAVEKIAPRSCCISRRSCIGFLSPGCSEVKRSCRCFLSKAAVLLVRRSFSFEYVSASSRLRMMSQTSLACKFIGQCCNNIVNPPPLARDVTGRELGHDLREPD